MVLCTSLFVSGFLLVEFRVLLFIAFCLLDGVVRWWVWLFDVFVRCALFVVCWRLNVVTCFFSLCSVFVVVVVCCLLVLVVCCCSL